MKNKTGQCKTCSSPNRDEIELALARGDSLGKVSVDNGVPLHSVWRHWRKHVSEERKTSFIVASTPDSAVNLEALKRDLGESRLQKLAIAQARLIRLANRCEEAGEHKEAIRATAELVRVLEAEAKLMGQLKTGSTTNINHNVLISPQWFQMKQVILSALRQHPAALRSVISAMRQTELENGADVSHARAIEYVPGERTDA